MVKKIIHIADDDLQGFILDNWDKYQNISFLTEKQKIQQIYMSQAAVFLLNRGELIELYNIINQS